MFGGQEGMFAASGRVLSCPAVDTFKGRPPHNTSYIEVCAIVLKA